MFTLPRFGVWLALLIFASTLRADPSLAHVRRAQALLGPDLWSEIIHVENESRSSAYPRELHALVFELAGILWFYTPVNGTQSFSLHLGRLAEEKADFAPLLRDIDPGFTRWTVLPHDQPAPVDPALPLANGCFVESVAALRERSARGDPIEKPRLLSYFVEGRGPTMGHTVLTYRRNGRLEIFDPARPRGRWSYPVRFDSDALALARQLDGADVVRARFVIIDPVSVGGATVLSARAAGPKVGTLPL